MLSKMKIMELYSIESLKSQIELATIATQRYSILHNYVYHIEILVIMQMERQYTEC